jgi:hypothetical protein
MEGMPGDTAVFDTATVTETTQSEFPDITYVGGVFQLYESPPLPIDNKQRDLHFACALWGGMPGNSILFASATVPQIIHKSDEAEIADVGEEFQLIGCTISANVYFAPKFACHSGLMGGMARHTAVFDTATVTETAQSEFPDITDVGGVLRYTNHQPCLMIVNRGICTLHVPCWGACLVLVHCSLLRLFPK